MSAWGTKLPPDHKRIIAEDTQAEATPALTVEGIDNHVYFYSDVNMDRILALMRLLRNTADGLRAEFYRRGVGGEPPPIVLHVHSFGGSLFAGLAAIDQIPALNYPIWSIVEGAVCSAATLVSMSANRRLITQNAFMMLHQLWSVHWGTHEQFRDELYMQEQVMEKLVLFYANRTNYSPEDIQEILRRDSWFDAAKAIEGGLVEGFYEPPSLPI